MTLGFSTQINGKPNYFIPKIWMGVPAQIKADISIYEKYYDNHVYQLGKSWDIPDDPIKAKLHTMREDPHDRWRAGMDIHMVINNRTKNRFQFAPVVKCVSTQEVRISYQDYLDGKYYVAGWFVSPRIIIDGRTILEHEVEELAINDGFESVNDFFAYFNSSCTKKIIHWTDLKY